MKKNIILIGSNGAGKTTIANQLYLHNYHYFKMSPLSDNNNVSELLTLDSNGIVFDRWSVVDLMVYRNDSNMFNNLKHRVEEFNKHNLVVFLHQGETIYDGTYSKIDGTIRVVARPDIESAILIDSEYNKLYLQLFNLGINTMKLTSRGDIEVMINYILERVKL